MPVVKHRKKSIFLYLLALCLAPLLSIGTAAAAQDNDTVTIYTDNYAEDDFMSYVAQQVIEENLDIKVKLESVDVGIAFVGTSESENGIFLDAWVPNTHADYMRKVEDKVDNYGTIYSDASIGWAVPSYVPEDVLGSIEDLKKPEVKKKLNSTIQGISAGAGEMRLSLKALDDYELSDYELISASGPAMTTELKRAIKNKQWIVATVWKPHWLWQRFDVRYLDDPKNVLGDAEHAVIIAHPSIQKNFPKLAKLLENMHYDIEQINEALAYAEDTSYKEAARHFVKNNPDVIESWLE